MKNKYAHKCICYEGKKGLNAIFLYFIFYQISDIWWKHFCINNI